MFRLNRQIPNLSLTGETAVFSLWIRQILEFSSLILYNNSTVSLCATKAAVWVYSYAAFSIIRGGKHLGVVDVYSKIPFDLSGSMSKNRFRQELCWGISKMFDLFDKEDFCVIFDYKCDI